MSSINFDNPYLLFIAIPLAALVAVPFFILVRKGSFNLHNILSLVLHLAIVCCVTLAVAGLRYEKVITKTSIYVLADVSYSTESDLNVADGYIRGLYDDMPLGCEMGVIAFADGFVTAVEPGQKIGSDFTLANYRSQVDTSGTDIGSALRYAGTLFADDVIKRIVVITDGVETAGDGRLTKTVSALSEAGVYIDAIFIDSSIGDSPEIQVAGVDCTPSAYVGRNETATVYINSNNRDDVRAVVRLTADGRSYARSVHAVLKYGMNAVELPLETQVAGDIDYKVDIRSDAAQNDTVPYNNSMLFSQTVADKVRVLFVGGSAADVAAGRTIYADAEVNYVTSPSAVPFTVEELCKYDEIAISNFDVRKMRNAEQFMAGLDTAVSKFGKTLTTYGNTYVQETGADTFGSLKKLGGMLPVTVGNSDAGARMITLVLDISTSMNFESRLFVARDAAISLLDVFKPNDAVMIIGFSGDLKILLTPTKITHRDEIVRAINSCSVRNGTLLSTALSEAYAAMDGYGSREVIVISDGLNAAADAAASLSMANAISASGAVISALAVYPTGGEMSVFLNGIVNNASAVAGGNVGYYKTIGSEGDVDYVIQSMVEDMQEVCIQGGSYAVTVRRPRDGYASGVTALSAVNGFWYSGAKSSAVTVADIKYVKDELTSYNVPLFAYWRYGAGVVNSFTSDIAVSSDWLDGWTGESDKKLLENIYFEGLPKTRVDTPFIITAELDGTVTTVSAVVASAMPDARLTVTLTSPDGAEQSADMVFDSLAYVAKFDTPAVGRYSVRLDCVRGAEKYSADAHFAVSYLKEYDSFTAYSPSALYRIVSQNGELSLDGKLAFDNSDSSVKTYTFSFEIPLLIACAALFVIDIIVRKLRLKDITSFFVRGKGGAK